MGVALDFILEQPMEIVHSNTRIAKGSETVHQMLVALVGKTVTHFRDDLLIHDANSISRM